MPETRVDPEENIQSLVAAARAPRIYSGRCTCGAEVEKTSRNLLSHADMIIVKLQRQNCWVFVVEVDGILDQTHFYNICPYFSAAPFVPH